MFYVMYFSSASTLDQVERIVLKGSPRRETSFKSNSDVVICDDSFTIKITTEGNHILFAREDYGYRFNYCFWFDVITGHDLWAIALMDITDLILRNLSTELVLESNGEKPFIIQDSTGLFVDPDLAGLEQFPFDRILLKMEKKVLMRQGK